MALAAIHMHCKGLSSPVLSHTACCETVTSKLVLVEQRRAIACSPLLHPRPPACTVAEAAATPQPALACPPVGTQPAGCGCSTRRAGRAASRQPAAAATGMGLPQVPPGEGGQAPKAFVCGIRAVSVWGGGGGCSCLQGMQRATGPWEFQLWGAFVWPVCHRVAGSLDVHGHGLCGLQLGRIAVASYEPSARAGIGRWPLYARSAAAMCSTSFTLGPALNPHSHHSKP